MAQEQLNQNVTLKKNLEMQLQEEDYQTMGLSLEKNKKLKDYTDFWKDNLEIII